MCYRSVLSNSFPKAFPDTSAVSFDKPFVPKSQYHVQLIEDLVARPLSEMGFEEIEATGKMKDRGIDICGTLLVGDVICTRMVV